MAWARDAAASVHRYDCGVMGGDPVLPSTETQNTVDPYSTVQLMQHPIATAELENRPREFGTGDILGNCNGFKSGLSVEYCC